jgi:type IX secretion system substrate protein
MKKLLLITFLLFSSFSFAQQTEDNNLVSYKNKPQATLTSVSAYPNPFNVSTKINFQSSKIQVIEFTVKNLLGKTVYLEQVNAKIGYNTIPFYRDDLTIGMYIYTLQTKNEIISKRLVIR